MAARTQLAEVIPQQRKEARAALEFQRQELDRYTNLVADNAAPVERLEQVRMSFTVAEAKVAEVDGLERAKAAEVAALEARVAALEEAVSRAELDLADCRLVSPFGGQVARVHEIPGGFVRPGEPVLTVQMMDPMKVQVAVSPGMDARIQYNDRVRVFVEGEVEPLEGFVYLKDTFADPATRTYLVTLLVRNQKVETAGRSVAPDDDTPRATGLWALEEREPGAGAPYFVEASSLLQDEQGYFVWKAEGVTVPQLLQDYDRRLRARKVRVTPGEERINIIQLFLFRELTDLGGLDPARDAILRGVPAQLEDGAEVLLLHRRWMLRPGDLVHVELRGPEAPRGFYVPEATLQFDGQQHHVFVLRDGGSSRATCARVDVTLAEVSGALQRIVPLDPKGLPDGCQVVLDGAHYVVDGEAVNPVREVSVSP